MAAVAPTDLVRASPNQILLKCTICMKKPTFSDLSHLLTHIGSKGHLSQLFKLSLRPNVVACQALADYHAWYTQHGIGNMLANRQTEKDKKDRAKAEAIERTRTSAANNGTPSTAGNTSNQKAQPNSQAASALMIAQCNMTPTNGLQLLGHPGNQALQDPAAQLASSAVSPNNGSLLSWGGLPSPAEIAENSALLSEMTVDPNLLDNKDDVLPNKALKGPIWPGMGSFDAASEEQRRRRNQRKDQSVLSRMVQTSEPDSEQEDMTTPKGGKKRGRRTGTKVKGKKNTTSKPSRVPPRGTRASQRIANTKGKKGAKAALTNEQLLPRDSPNGLYHSNGYNTNNHGDDGDYMANGMYSASQYSAGPLNGLDLYNSPSTGFFPASSDGGMFPDSSEFSPHTYSLLEDSDPSPNRTESPWDDNSFDSQRTAMQSLNPNNMHIALACQLPQSLSSSSFAFLSQADGISSGFPSQSQSPVLPDDASTMAAQSPTLQARANPFFSQQHIGNDQYHAAYAHHHDDMSLQPFNFCPTVSSAEDQSLSVAGYQSVQTGNTTTVGSNGGRPRLTYSDFQTPYSAEGVVRGGHSEFNI